MLVGRRQWADGGSDSSGLPHDLVQQARAHKIGKLKDGGFYFFQMPGTHDLVRPLVRFKEGYPQTLETPRNEFYYTGDEEHGTVIFIGDEPHLDVERYTASILDAAQKLN